MMIRQGFRTVGVILLLLFGLGIASADDFTFNATNGAWGLALNWLGPPNRFPGPGDTATILTGQTCTVQSAEFAEIVTVNSGGTLIIDASDSLTIDTNGDGTNDTPTLTVNGTLKLEKSGGTAAKLLYGNTGLSSPNNKFTINGTGTILADGSAGHAGFITNLSGSEHILEIESGVTVRGSITIVCSNGVPFEPGMKLDGTFVVDNANDDMQIGGTGALRYVRASPAALFHVSNGQMSLNKGMIPDPDFAGTLKVSGTGQLFIRPMAAGAGAFLNLQPFPNAAAVEVAGGTLSIERAWRSHGGLEFDSGAIKLKVLLTAAFMEAP